MSIKILVIDENVIGCNDGISNNIGILSASVLMGCGLDRLCGYISKPTDESRIRLANRQDLENFRLYNSYEDSEYAWDKNEMNLYSFGSPEFFNHIAKIKLNLIKK